MKQKGCTKLKTQAAAITAGLIFSAAVLITVFISSETYLTKLSGDINARLNAAIGALEKGDYAQADEAAKQIHAILTEAEPALQLFVNHRDITELMKYAEDAALIGDNGEKDAYIADFTGIHTLLCFLRDNNRFSLSGVL